MKYWIIFVLTCLATVSADAQTEVPNIFQTGQPARAADVNENFAALQGGVQKLKATFLTESLNSGVTNLNFDYPLTFFGEQLYTCGQAYLYGCNRATSDIGTQFVGVSYRTRSNSVRLEVADGTGLRLWAVPVTVIDFSQLRFVGEANLYGARGMGQVLVDDCDNPTIALLDNARNPRPDDNGPETIMNNAGHVYTRDSEVPTRVDVSGKTYGVLNFIQSEDPTPLCTPGVSDRTGFWDQYTYSFAADTNGISFKGPYTYTGTRTGLIDRVESLEARIQALEDALP